MSRARFLHTADLHLSRRFGFLPPQLAEERRRDQRRTLVRIADLVLEKGVELLLVAGDLFDSPDPDPTDLEVVTREFSRLGEAGRHIFIIPGNHDHVSKNNFWRRLAIPSLRLFLEPEWRCEILENLGIAVCGAAFDRAGSERRAFAGLEIPADLPAIVMAHASCEAFEGRLERYHPFSPSELQNTGASYVALGHYHRFNPIASETPACYPGTPEGISFDGVETEERFVVCGEIDDDGNTSFEPIRVNRKTMRSVEIDCTSFESTAGLFDAVRRVCEPNALIRLRLSGAPTPDVDFALDDLPNRFRESCLHLCVDSSALSLPVDLPSDDQTIRGRFCRRLLEQVESCSDPERRRLLQRALELGLMAFSEE